MCVRTQNLAVGPWMETFVLSFDSEVVFILKSQANLEDTFKRLVSTGSQ